MLLGLMAGCRPADSRPVSETRTRALADLTGGRARVVWVRTGADADDIFLKGKGHRLMGFDTREGKERELWASPDQINKPMLGPDGSFVVFSRFRDDRIFHLPWGDRAPREIGRGYALDVWRDPESGRDWLYAAVDRSSNPDAPYRRIVRFPLDRPTKVEEVWANGDVSMDNVDLSRDGKRLGGMFPWPRGLLVDTSTREATALGRGCWSSLAPDNSYVLWVFDGSHRHLFFHTPDGRRRWRTTINTIPGGDNRRMYHPRWSNHARFMAVTGPHQRDARGRRTQGAGRAVEVWVGRFSEDLQRVEAWARITDNDAGDVYPDLWVEGGPLSTVAESAVKDADSGDVHQPELSASWPGTEEGLVYRWAHGNTRNEVLDPATGQPVECAPEPVGGARFTRHFGMDIRRGRFRDSAAGERVRDAMRAADALTLEVTLTPRQTDLKGPARIVSFGRGVGNANFVLGQEGRQLVFRLRTPETGRDGTAQDSQITLASLTPGRPVHLVISYRPGELAAYLDGQALPVPQKIQGGFETWEEAELTFGDTPEGNRTWDGELEGVALFRRFIGAAEARRHYELYEPLLRARTPSETVRVRARLVQATPTPLPADLAPYRRALAMYVYELEEGEPAIEGSRRIQVNHWVVLDGKAVAQPPAPGSLHDLVLESTAERPELESERRLVATDEFDLPEFLDVSR